MGYLNYAGIGWVIGHEITHGFDDQGRQFGPNGNLAEWWAPKTKEQYLERAECIINQYGNYSFPELDGLKINGITTQGAANVWCQKSRPESLKLRILTGQHSPSRFRVRGPFANMPEFASDFKCSLKQQMNPVNKCAVR